MPSISELLERESSTVDLEPGDFERLVRRRDRKRRNQRIAAGVVGIAVFVAAVWIVTSGGVFDRSTPAVPGSETRPTQTAPPPARASAAPDVVSLGTCDDGPPREAISRLRLAEMVDSDSIKVRFTVGRSPVGHSWHIVLRHAHTGGIGPFHWHHARIFERTRVASESGDLAVQWNVVNQFDRIDGFRAVAADRQTGQVCKAEATIPAGW